MICNWWRAHHSIQAGFRIVIKKNSLSIGIIYRLAVLVSNTDGFAGISAYDFLTSLPPVGGTCTIEPSSGIALRTYFTLRCSGWTSSNTPLSYQFQVLLYHGLTSVVYHGFNTSVESLMPSGDLSQNFTLKLNVTVSDSNGASATYANLTVQVGLSERLDKMIFKGRNLVYKWTFQPQRANFVLSGVPVNHAFFASVNSLSASIIKKLAYIKFWPLSFPV